MVKKNDWVPTLALGNRNNQAMPAVGDM